MTELELAILVQESPIPVDIRDLLGKMAAYVEVWPKTHIKTVIQPMIKKLFDRENVGGKTALKLKEEVRKRLFGY
jgi:hypothetical protein